MFRFLIVDDNADDALQISFLIEQDFSTEAKCEHASTRRQALDWLDERKHQPFDAILLDLNLGDSDGPETFRSVRSAVGVQVPIVVWSGRGDERGLRDLLIEEGAAGYLEKGSVRPTQIFETLRDAARLSKVSYRFDLGERQVLIENERRTKDLVTQSRASDPPMSANHLLAEAFAANMRTMNNMFKRVVHLDEQVSSLKGQVVEAEGKIHKVEELSDTQKRKAVSLEEATLALKKKHDAIAVEQAKLAAKDVELEEMAKENKRRLFAIGTALAITGYGAGEFREEVFKAILRLFGVVD